MQSASADVLDAAIDAYRAVSNRLGRQCGPVSRRGMDGADQVIVTLGSAVAEANRVAAVFRA